MKKLPLLLLALLPVLAFAHKNHAHNHGVGQLGIVVEGEQLTLLLEVPQHDIVGFERAAKTAREQVTVQAALEKLKTPSKLFAPTAAAQCEVLEQKIDAPLLEGAKGQQGHGDIEARYVYRCAQPAALVDLKSMVSTEFPRLRTLNVSFSGPQGQKAGKVDAKNASFRW
jgi:hypothetical protein